MKLEKVKSNLRKSAIEAAAILPVFAELTSEERNKFRKIVAMQTIICNGYDLNGTAHVNCYVKVILTSADGTESLLYLVDGFWYSRENVFLFGSREEYENGNKTLLAYPKRVNDIDVSGPYDDEDDDMFHVICCYWGYDAEDAVFSTEKEAIDYTKGVILRSSFSSPRMLDDMVVPAEDEFCYIIRTRNETVYLTDYYKLSQTNERP